MFDDYDCSRCGEGYKWEQLSSTPEGNLFCPSCRKQLDGTGEPKRRCPVEGAEMLKHSIAGVVLIDRCSVCGGTWFDKGELEIIRKKAEDEGWSKGFFVGWLF